MFLISVPCKEKSALEVVSSWDPRTHLLGLAVVMPLISLIGTRQAPQSHPCKIHFVTGPSSHGTVRSDCCGRKVLGAVMLGASRLRGRGNGREKETGLTFCIF